jgi:hypothetical protein
MSISSHMNEAHALTNSRVPESFMKEYRIMFCDGCNKMRSMEGPHACKPAPRVEMEERAQGNPGPVAAYVSSDQASSKVLSSISRSKLAFLQDYFERILMKLKDRNPLVTTRAWQELWNFACLYNRKGQNDQAEVFNQFLGDIESLQQHQEHKQPRVETNNNAETEEGEEDEEGRGREESVERADAGFGEGDDTFGNHPATPQLRPVGMGPNAQPKKTAQKKGQREEKQKTAEEKRVERACHLISLGNIQKAVQSLKPGKLHEPSKALCDELCKLFPTRQEAFLPRKPTTAAHREVPVDDWMKVIYKCTPGAAAGPSGMSDQMLKQLLNKRDNSKILFAAALNQMMNLEAPEFVNTLLGMEMIAPLMKNAQKNTVEKNVRPIAPEELYSKIISKAIIEDIKKLVENDLQCGRQYGLSGAERATHRLRKDMKEFFDLHGTHPMVGKFDMSNAYGCLNIEKTWEIIAQTPYLQQHIRALYATTGTGNHLYTRDEAGNRAWLMHNRSSLMQGRVLSPLLFGITIQPAVERAVREIEETIGWCRVIMYIDDITIILPADKGDDVRRLAKEIIAKHMITVGLTVNDAKTEWLIPDSNFPQSKAPTRFIEVLGIPIYYHDDNSESTRQAVREWVATRIKLPQNTTYRRDMIPILQAINSPVWRQHPAEVMTMLTKVILPSTNYIARNVDATLTVETFKEFDEHVYTTFRDTMDFDVEQGGLEVVKRLIALPMSMGGCGLRRVSEIAPLAYMCCQSSFQVDRKKHMKQKIEVTKYHQFQRKQLLEELQSDEEPHQWVRAPECAEWLASKFNATCNYILFYPHKAEAYRLNISQRLFSRLRGLGNIRTVVCARCGTAINEKGKLDHHLTCKKISKWDRHEEVKKCVKMLVQDLSGIQFINEPSVARPLDFYTKQDEEDGNEDNIMLSSQITNKNTKEHQGKKTKAPHQATAEPIGLRRRADCELIYDEHRDRDGNHTVVKTHKLIDIVVSVNAEQARVSKLTKYEDIMKHPSQAHKQFIPLAIGTDTHFTKEAAQFLTQLHQTALRENFTLTPTRPRNEFFGEIAAKISESNYRYWCAARGVSTATQW